MYTNCHVYIDFDRWIIVLNYCSTRFRFSSWNSFCRNMHCRLKWVQQNVTRRKRKKKKFATYLYETNRSLLLFCNCIKFRTCWCMNFFICIILLQLIYENRSQFFLLRKYFHSETIEQLTSSTLRKPELRWVSTVNRTQKTVLVSVNAGYSS